ncbi:hypothetical protein [Roseomonas sp. KE2513]|nr:hypothetical protein [Roseomonas sp. KE2513]
MSDTLFELMCAVAAHGATLLTLVGGGLWLELSRRRDLRRRQAPRLA